MFKIKFKFLLTILILLISVPTISAAVLDNFEDGDYTNNPTWTVDSGTWNVQNSIAKVGIWALENTSEGFIYFDRNEPADTYTSWIRIPSSTFRGLLNITNDTTVIAKLGINADKMQYWDGSFHQIDSLTASPNTWYRFAITYVDGASTMDVEVFNDINVSIGKVNGVNVNSAATVNRFWVESHAGTIFDLSGFEKSSTVKFTTDGNQSLDPENGVSSVDRNFIYTGTKDGNHFWFENSVLVSQDVNLINHSFTYPSDYNIALIVEAIDGNGYADANVKIKQFPQDVNFTWTPFLPNPFSDVNFFGSTDEDANITNWYWGFPDGNHSSTTDQNVTTQFSNSGVQETCLTVQDNEDLNKTECNDVNVQLSLRVRFWDENNTTNLQPTVTVNGTDFSGSVDSNGFLVLEISVGTFTIVAFTANHGERTWILDVNGTVNVDENLSLLPSSLGRNIQFRFFAPNDTTVLANTNVTITYDTNNFLASKTITDTLGRATYFLRDKDFNYTFALRGSDGNFDYNGTILTVKKPLDLTNLSIEITPFDLDISNLTSQNFSGLTDDTPVLIFSDTIDFYLFFVDANNDYFPTSKLIQTKGGDLTSEYQPYLIPIDPDKGIEVTIFTINNQENRQSLPDIRIESFTDINGVPTLVESKFSDGTGVALFHFELDRLYLLNFYQGTELKISENVFISSNVLYAFIETGVLEFITTEESVQIEWGNQSNLIPNDSNFIHLEHLIKPFATTIGDINVSVFQEENLIFNQIFTADTNVDYNLVYDVNVNGLNSVIPLTVTLNVFNDSNVLLTTQSATFTFINNVVWKQGLDYLKEGLGTLSLTILTIIFGIMIIWLITNVRIGEDNNWLTIPMMIFTGFFMFIGFIPFVDWAMACLFAFTLTVWRVRD